MGRKNRRSRSAAPKDLSFLAYRGAPPVTKGGSTYAVRQIIASKALKTYICPGCQQQIMPHTAHLVAWRKDSIMGDSAALADRRHWHNHCWRIFNG